MLGVRAQIRKRGKAEGPSALACGRPVGSGRKTAGNIGESDLSAPTAQVPRAEASSRVLPCEEGDRTKEIGIDLTRSLKLFRYCVHARFGVARTALVQVWTGGATTWKRPLHTRPLRYQPRDIAASNGAASAYTRAKDLPSLAALSRHAKARK